ncbi:hypothetical protein RJ639_004236 [Escallonia herrerae]|uniref:Uncharacterized protein n=1 Tax=Escallonia herrerae TaxID=1293975 RepID=A0AA89AX36_9ASTE|nr:hypothetical protein RJ639_004236 [Escallonia herrerae]
MAENLEQAAEYLLLLVVEIDFFFDKSGTKTVSMRNGGLTKVDIRVAPGTHATEAAVNKQLNDKERVAAALKNPNLSAPRCCYKAWVILNLLPLDNEDQDCKLHQGWDSQLHYDVKRVQSKKQQAYYVRISYS